jgi:hypothetical protein
MYICIFAALTSAMCRYIYIFRSKLSKPLLVETFPKIVRLVAADSNVVHSYAAIAAERLLALHINGTPLLTQQDVSEHLQELLKLLFEALGKEESTENEHLVKCVMRVINFVGPQIVPIADQCLDWCAFSNVCEHIHFGCGLWRGCFVALHVLGRSHMHVQQ